MKKLIRLAARVGLGVFIFFVGMAILLNVAGVVPAPSPEMAAEAPAAAVPAAEPPSSAPPVDTLAKVESAQAIAQLTDAGLVRRVDLDAGAFYVDRLQWETFELPQRETFVRVASVHRKTQINLEGVTIYDSRSGKRLASYGVWQGLRFEE